MKITVNGIELNYVQSGSGPVVLLLHGNGEDHQVFEKLQAKLADTYTVYAIDSRNHGESTKTTDYSYETMAQDIVAFVAELKLHPIRIIGFSDGAIIGIKLALLGIPMERLALLGVNLSPAAFKKAEYMLLELEYQQTKSPLIKLMLDQPQIRLEEVTIINSPTLVIAGENDVFRPETFSELAKALPQAELLVFENETHDSYVINPNKLVDSLKLFLK
ncbi:hypothetical protein BFC20_10465 [Brochothrix thermosphacta]|uniref:alpha/beta fold hydrolase n=1 Tax=Brochothrix thermosphacta TaxID=2756 RepID=UPI000E72FF62|nr:alpha/beta hydrolase [Brochothrix thermosphacta]ANZ98096.1 hypothetical protein BFC20_10465 [Brochothrix thermosphacta]